jgi:protein SCO1/2
MSKPHKPIYGLMLGMIVTLFAFIPATIAQTDLSLYVAGAWARPSTEGNDVSAAYLQITNRGDHDERLVSASTDAAHMTEIHTMQMHDDVMQMRRVEHIEIPAGETVVLRPGGLHIMLMGLTHPLIEGDTLALTLTFESGMTIQVEAQITPHPIPDTLPVDALTEQALQAADEGVYVGQVVNPPIMTQDALLPSSHPEVESLHDLNGTWRVIFFGYMRCPDFCPLTLVKYKRVHALLGDEASNVTFVFITVDADRDTPEALQNYLANYASDFIGFSADDTTLARIQPDYGFYYERRMDSGSQAVYTIDHSTRSYLLDRDGVLRATFAYDADIQDVTSALFWYMEHE